MGIFSASPLNERDALSTVHSRELITSITWRAGTHTLLQVLSPKPTDLVMHTSMVQPSPLSLRPIRGGNRLGPRVGSLPDLNGPKATADAYGGRIRRGCGRVGLSCLLTSTVVCERWRIRCLPAVAHGAPNRVRVYRV
jgi:hypothetical protein